MAKLKWRTNRFIRDLNAHVLKTMKKIVLFMEGEVKRAISRGNRTGLNPSRPGEPPKVRTGTLRANVAGVAGIEQGEVVGVVGVRKGLANAYAPLLEEKGIRDGTTRPFLRPTVLKNRVRILNMLR